MKRFELDAMSLRILTSLHEKKYKCGIEQLEYEIFNIYSVPHAINVFDKLSDVSDFIIAKGFIKVEDNIVHLTSEGIDYIGEFWLFETDKIMDDIFYSYEYALLKFLYKYNSHLDYKIFPDIFINLNPEKLFGDKQHSFHIYLRNNKYLISYGTSFAITDAGEQYLLFLRGVRNKERKKSKREKELIKSSIRANTTSIRNALATGIISFSILVMQGVEIYTDQSKNKQEESQQAKQYILESERIKIYQGLQSTIRSFLDTSAINESPTVGQAK